jgi:5-methylcytosine-specific restriction protein A
LKSKCFRILEANGFTIITKGDKTPFPDEMDESRQYIEGAVQRILVNRYERDPHARAKSVKHYGLRCQVCEFDFEAVYGTLGQGFIHVHHTVELSKIGKPYIVDPIKELKPVCPNCHAMLHKRERPYSIDELRDIPRRTQTKN